MAELELENERLTALLAAHGIQDDSTIRHGGSQPAPAPAGQSPGPPGAATLQVRVLSGDASQACPAAGLQCRPDYCLAAGPLLPRLPGVPGSSVCSSDT